VFWIAIYILFVAAGLAFMAANNAADLRQDAYDRDRTTPERARPTGRQHVGGWLRRVRLR
jgi:hypothetical protein